MFGFIKNKLRTKMVEDIKRKVEIRIKYLLFFCVENV